MNISAQTTIARVDSSLARMRRTDRVTDGALALSIVVCVVALVLAGHMISKAITRKADKVGVQWP